MITLRKQSQRIYFDGNTFAVKDRIKSIGGKWDADNKAWWVGAAKADAAEKLIAEIAEIASQPPSESQATTRSQRPASEVRLTGKGICDGRSCFLGPQTKDGTKILILGLPKEDGSYFECWVEIGKVEVTKTYEPREFRGRTEYTTLGSIASFIRRQKNEGTRRVQCHECDAWHDIDEKCRECGGC